MMVDRPLSSDPTPRLVGTTDVPLVFAPSARSPKTGNWRRLPLLEPGDSPKKELESPVGSRGPNRAQKPRSHEAIREIHFICDQAGGLCVNGRRGRNRRLRSRGAQSPDWMKRAVEGMEAGIACQHAEMDEAKRLAAALPATLDYPFHDWTATVTNCGRYPVNATSASNLAQELTDFRSQVTLPSPYRPARPHLLHRC